MPMSSLNDQVARETVDGQVIYPDRLPKVRKSRAEKLAVSIIGLLVSGAAAMKNYDDDKPPGYMDSFIHIIACLSSNIAVMSFGEILTRVCLLYEERHHLLGRYEGKWSLLLRNIVNCNSATLIVAGVSYLFLLVQYLQKGGMESLMAYICELNPKLHIVIAVISYVIIRVIRMDKSQLGDSILMERMQPLDYGSGMALNFFYGYLRLVLPNTGDSEKGLKERIEDYIAAQKLDGGQFPVKKLFILIPASTYVPTNLTEVSYHWMEPAQNLAEQVKNRAGVTDRVYKNSVYKIQDPNDPDAQPTYVVAEGATPLKTLYEVVQYSGEKKEFFKKHQKEIILSFYERLRAILREDRDCRDLCELVYYVDTDEYGNPNVNAARKILDRIEEIQDREAFFQYQRQEDF